MMGYVTVKCVDGLEKRRYANEMKKTFMYPPKKKKKSAKKSSVLFIFDGNNVFNEPYIGNLPVREKKANRVEGLTTLRNVGGYVCECWDELVLFLFHICVHIGLFTS